MALPRQHPHQLQQELTSQSPALEVPAQGHPLDLRLLFRKAKLIDPDRHLIQQDEPGAARFAEHTFQVVPIIGGGIRHIEKALVIERQPGPALFPYQRLQAQPPRPRRFLRQRPAHTEHIVLIDQLVTPLLPRLQRRFRIRGRGIEQAGPLTQRLSGSPSQRGVQALRRAAANDDIGLPLCGNFFGDDLQLRLHGVALLLLFFPL